MTCQDCRYYNPEVKHKCDKYPAVFPMDDVEICGSFRPIPQKEDCLTYRADYMKTHESSWDEVSK